MARGKRTDEKTVYAVMASWAVTNNCAETARVTGLSESTVKNIVKKNKDKDEFVEVGRQKKTEFSEYASRIIDKALRRLEAVIDSDDKDIPVNHLTTVIGTLYDKKALADGNATDNVKLEIRLPEGIDEYAE